MKKKAKQEVASTRGTVCSFCDHVYIFPCDGERYDCANAVWVRSKGTIDFGKLTPAERDKITKTGKLPNVNTQHRSAPEPVKRPKIGQHSPGIEPLRDEKPTRRVRIEPETPKKKKRRIRL